MKFTLAKVKDQDYGYGLYDSEGALVASWDEKKPDKAYIVAQCEARLSEDDELAEVEVEAIVNKLITKAKPKPKPKAPPRPPVESEDS